MGRVGIPANGEKLPRGVDFNGRFIYYVGVVTTRMDKVTEAMLAQNSPAEKRIGMIPLKAI